MGTQRFVLGVDLDGVCADFYSGLRPIAAEWLGVPLRGLPTEVSFGLQEWKLDALGGYEELHRYAVTQKGLFGSLKPIKGAPVTLRRLAYVHDVRIRIITHRLFIKYSHQLAINQTTEWLDTHGIPYWDLCFLKDKAAVGADLYIEDSPDNVESLRKDGHSVIVFTNSTNRKTAGPRADSWKDVERLVLKELKRWKAASHGKRVTSGR